jgi:hypothetical protein
VLEALPVHRLILPSESCSFPPQVQALVPFQRAMQWAHPNQNYDASLDGSTLHNPQTSICYYLQTQLKHKKDGRGVYRRI